MRFAIADEPANELAKFRFGVSGGVMKLVNGDNAVRERLGTKFLISKPKRRVRADED